MSDQLDEKINSRQFKVYVIAPLAILTSAVLAFWSFAAVVMIIGIPVGLYGFFCLFAMWRTLFLMGKGDAATEDDAVRHNYMMLPVLGFIVLVFGVAFLGWKLIPFPVDHGSSLAQSLSILHFPVACVCFGILTFVIGFWKPKAWPTYSPARVMEGFSTGRIILYQVCSAIAVGILYFLAHVRLVYIESQTPEGLAHTAFVESAFATAMCTGNTAGARAALKGGEIVETEAIKKVVNECLGTGKSMTEGPAGGADPDSPETAYGTLVPEKIDLAFDAIMANEKHRGVYSAGGCTELQSGLLRRFYTLDVGYLHGKISIYAPTHAHFPGLMAFRERALRIDCVGDSDLEAGAMNQTPFWWYVIISNPEVSISDLDRLHTLGVSFSQADSRGNGVLLYGKIAQELSKEALSYLVEHGAQPPKEVDAPR